MTEKESCCATTYDEKCKSHNGVGGFWHWLRKVLWGTSPDESRLAGDICYYRKRLDYLKKDSESTALWAQSAEDLLNDAQNALNEDNNDLSWRCLDSARSFLMIGLDEKDLEAEAQAILNEAEDPGKKISSWRKKTIQENLCHDGKLKQNLQGMDLFNASANLFENHHNKYSQTLRRRTPLQAGGACEAPPHKAGSSKLIHS
jgi:hypothetical protein